jgi:hypothetical protein
MFRLRIGGISRAESDPRAANRIVKLSGMFLVTVTVRLNHTDSGYPRYSEKSLFLCHSVSHKSHVYWPGIEPSPSWRNRPILTPIEGQRTGSATSTGRCVQPPDGEEIPTWRTGHHVLTEVLGRALLRHSLCRC